jgi:hypothetical protein
MRAVGLSKNSDFMRASGDFHSVGIRYGSDLGYGIELGTISLRRKKGNAKVAVAVRRL